MFVLIENDGIDINWSKFISTTTDLDHICIFYVNKEKQFSTINQ